MRGNMALTGHGHGYNRTLPIHLCPGGGMVDALASGASVLMDVEVQVLFWAPITSRFSHKT